MDNDAKGESLDEHVDHVKDEFEQNWPLPDDAARAAAEDDVLRSVPAPSSLEVENERVRRAQQEDASNQGSR